MPTLDPTARLVLGHLLKPLFAFPTTLDPRKVDAFAGAIELDPYDVARALKQIRMLTLDPRPSGFRNLPDVIQDSISTR